MSYSMVVRGTSKDDALAALVRELDQLVKRDPAHATDREQVEAAATAFLAVLPVDPARDVQLTVNGSLSWEAGTAGKYFVGAVMNIVVKAVFNVRADLVTKQ